MGRKYLGHTLYWRKLIDGKYTWKKAEARPYINDDGWKFLAVIIDDPSFYLEEEE